MSLQFNQSWSVEEIEAKAVFMVIKLALKINFVDITLEGDNVIMGNVNGYFKGIGLKTIF